MKSIITSHNKKLLKSKHQTQAQPCNCRKKADCPLDGECQSGPVVYRAAVNTDNTGSNLTHTDRVYIGCTENFKSRYSDHLQDFKNKSRQNRTRLALHIWTLKSYKVKYTIKWSIVAKASPYSSGSRSCDLCTTEKLKILELHKNSPNTILNKRSEIANKCRHRAKFKLNKA